MSCFCIDHSECEPQDHQNAAQDLSVTVLPGYSSTEPSKEALNLKCAELTKIAKLLSNVCAIFDTRRGDGQLHDGTFSTSVDPMS